MVFDSPRTYGRVTVGGCLVSFSSVSVLTGSVVGGGKGVGLIAV